MGIFDKDPKYQALKKLRDDGYKGWVNQDGKPSDRRGRPIDPKTGKRTK